MAVVKFNALEETEFNELHSNWIFDNVEGEKEKPSIVGEGYSKRTSNLVSAKYDRARQSDNSIITGSPNLCKQRGDSMSNTHINLFRSKETFDLLENDPKAFLLFSYISLMSTRGFDSISELQEGECFISRLSTPKKCGLTEKEYREAKKRLIKQGLIVEIFNPDWMKNQKNEKEETKQQLEIFKKRAMKRATKSCIVRMVESDVYDINVVSKGQQKGQQRASKGPAKGHIQEYKEYKQQVSVVVAQKSANMTIVDKEPIPLEMKFTKDDLYAASIRLRKDWNCDEIEEAWEIYNNKKDSVESPFDYIEGIIKKRRLIRKSEQLKNNKENVKSCSRKYQTTKRQQENIERGFRAESQNSKLKISENAIKKRPLVSLEEMMKAAKLL